MMCHAASFYSKGWPILESCVCSLLASPTALACISSSGMPLGNSDVLLGPVLSRVPQSVRRVGHRQPAQDIRLRSQPKAVLDIQRVVGVLVVD